MRLLFHQIVVCLFIQDSINFRVHSVRDMEEENRILKKDNFNLKLKIYHLNEKMRKMEPVELSEEAEYSYFKENLELMVMLLSVYNNNIINIFLR